MSSFELVGRESSFDGSSSCKLGAIFAPLEVPQIIKLSNFGPGVYGDRSSVSSFDMSSLTRGDDEVDDAGSLNKRLSRHPVDQLEAFERARELALNIASEEAAENENQHGQSNIFIFWSCFLFFLSFLPLFCVAGGSVQEKASFDNSPLINALETEAYRQSLFFSTGCCAPMVLQFVAQLIGWIVMRSRQKSYSTNIQRTQSLVVIIACGLLNLTILIPNVGRLIWIAQGNRLSNVPSLYVGIFCFQLCSFVSIVCGLLSSHVPDIKLLRHNVIICGGLFIAGIVMYTFCQTFVDFPYRQGIYIACGFISLSGILYFRFLFQFLKIVTSGYRQSQNGALLYMNPKNVWVCVITTIGFLLFICLDEIGFSHIKSLRARDFGTFNVCYHTLTKAALMITISYLVPLRLTEIFVKEAEQSVHQFLKAILQ